MRRTAQLPPELADLARRRYGVLGIRDIDDRLSRHELAGLVARGVLDHPHRGVYRVVAAPRSFRQRAAVAVAAYGPPVAASHLTAARLWGAEVAPREVEVTLPGRRSGRRELAAVHHAELPPDEVGVRLHLPVTVPGRTVVDLATGPCRQPDATVLQVLDDLAGARQLTPAALADAVDAAHRRRVPGHRRLDALLGPHLEALGGGADSALEGRVHRAIVAAGVPQPVRQHQAVVDGRVRLLDLAWPPVLLAVQVDGYRWHGGRRRFDDDRWLDSALAELGWLVVRVTSAMDLAVVAARVARAHAARTR